MTRHLLGRLASAGFVLFAVSVVTFYTLAATPGDVVATLIGDSASQEQMDALRHELGLDEPLAVRYLKFASALVFRGDLGQSLISGRSVAELLAERIPYTLILALAAMGLASGVGLTTGIVAARKAGSAWDTVIMGAVSLGIALPSFWIALLLIMLFSLRLHWFPVVGAGSPKHLVLPAITLALPTAAVVARLVRSSLLDVMGADYIRTAEAKGLKSRRVLTHHIMRNSFIPVVTLLGLHLGYLLGGAFIVETIFGWPGLGRLTVQAVFDRDLPIVLGAALLIAFLYVLINLGIDLAHAWLDPRVGHDAL